ncbi:MAG: DUF4867 family protein [Desulfitobacterium hafniense]|nr:DUF4867 family protein [Desulfitobacterium hafniense]
MNLDVLKRLNKLAIKEVTDFEFQAYGRVLTDYDFSGLISYMETETEIPAEGNIYVPSVQAMEELPIKDTLEFDIYGEMQIEIGYCNGRNSNLNGLEYHKGSEINIAVTDMILLLGKVQNIRDNRYMSSQVEAFYIPKGTAVELYATSLHFAPCKTVPEGFKCVVILPWGTNLPLSRPIGKSIETQTLFAKNKWLLAHPERKVLIEKGAYPGIIGENIEIIIS